MQRRGQPGWYFTGRTVALEELVAWLTVPSGSGTAARVVTGNPGSGKSAVLARLVTLAHPEYRATTPAAVLAAAPAGTVPPLGSVQVALHAAGKAPEQVTAELAAALGHPVSTSRELVEAILDSQDALVIVVDALDEAAPPEPLIRELLRPLMLDDLAGRVRLLVGTRRHLLPLFPGVRVLDLDTAEYFDPGDLAAYALGLLGMAHGPYSARPGLARRVADAIADRAERSFLVTQLAARALASDPSPVDDTRAGWQERLPATVGAAMDHYLACIPEDERRIRDLLRPLAWAEGDGLADDELWAVLATALGTAAYQAHEVRWLRSTAAASLLQATHAAEGVAYRLFHQALADHLRAFTPTLHAQQTITTVLCARVPTLPLTKSRMAGSPPLLRNWHMADRYTRVHLASHAAMSGMLRMLIADPLYLVIASPPRLRHALTTAEDLTETEQAAVYRQTAHLLAETDPGGNAAYLELAARLAGGDPWADQLAALPVRRPWQVPWAHGHAAQPHSRIISEQAGPIRALATAQAPNGRLVLITGGDDGTVRVWDLLDHTQLREPLRGHTGMIAAIVTTRLPDGRLAVVSLSSDGTIRTWDLATGEQVGEPLLQISGSVRALATGVLPDDRRIVITGSSDATVQVRDLLTGESLCSLRGHAGGIVDAVAATRLPNGQVLVISAGNDQTVRVWDALSGELVGSVLIGHTGVVNTVATSLSPDGRPIIVSGSHDRTVRLWDLTDGVALGPPLRGHTDWVWTVATGVLPNGRAFVVSGGHDGLIQIWDLVTGTPLGQPLPGHTGTVEVVAAATLPDGRAVVVSGGSDGLVRVWDLATRKPLGKPIRGHTGWVQAVATGTLPGGQACAISGDQQGFVLIWDLATGAPLGEPLEGHSGPVQAVAAATLPDGRAVAISGGNDGLVRVWDLATRKLLGEPLRGHTGWVRAVAAGILPDGRAVVVSGGHDRLVRAWDLGTGEPLGEPWQGHTEGVRGVATNTLPDGRMVVVTGGRDGLVWIWDLATGTPLGEPLRGHIGWVRAVATGVMPDGRVIVASNDSSGVVHLWDLRTRQPLGDPLEGHTSFGRALVSGTLPDGRLIIVSGSADGMIQVWEFPSRRCTHRIALGAVIYGLALRPPSLVLVAGAHGLLRIDLHSTRPNTSTSLGDPAPESACELGHPPYGATK